MTVDDQPTPPQNPPPEQGPTPEPYEPPFIYFSFEELVMPQVDFVGTAPIDPAMA